MSDAGVKAAVKAAGSLRKLGHALGISHQTIALWKRVPDKYILRVEKVTGIDREQLRPDLYRRSKTASKKHEPTKQL